MEIKEFDKLYWSGKLTQVDYHMYFYKQPLERRTNQDAKTFDPHYSFHVFGGKQKTAREIEAEYDKYAYVKTFHGKKFILGDYTFYGYHGMKEPSDFYKGETKTGFTFIMDFHGYRKTVMYFEQYVYDEKSHKYHVGQYGKSYKGYEEFLSLLDDFSGDLLDYDVNELFGNIKKGCLQPSPYKYTKNYKPIGEIDVDYFIKLETVNGVYKPSASMVNILFYWEFDRLFKPKVKYLKDLDIHTIQFRNNAVYNILNFYDLEGVEIKASKSVLQNYPKFQQYSKNEELQKKIDDEKEKADKAYAEYIHKDTYTLSHHGKIILENVRSYEIKNYFENKEMIDFELGMIEAGKKVFEAAPEMTKIFFLKYGIHSYSELSGERFVDHEDLEYINKHKGIKVPSRIVTLHHNGIIEPSWFSIEDKLFTFEKGATYIGAELKNGKVVMITESGSEGI